MEMSYNPNLVLLSYFIASLAGYVTLELAGRVRANREVSRLRWVMFGAFCMGSGIWSMHFIGMEAMNAPFELSYDVALTFVSWIAAIAASSIALWVVSNKRVDAKLLSVAAIAMGSAIAVMHYLGMAALQMSTPISYETGWFVASLLIAVGASGAAMLIAVSLKPVKSIVDIGIRVGAAMVMGLAIAGMHYSGMAAADIAMGSVPADSNMIRGDSIVLLTAFGGLSILGLALFVSITNTRELIRQVRAAREEELRVRNLAFIDRETGLANRAAFTQDVSKAIRKRGSRAAILTLRFDGKEKLSAKELREVSRILQAGLAEHAIGRPSPDYFAVLKVGGNARDLVEEFAPLGARLTRLFARQRVSFSIGAAQYPEDGETAQMLIFRANGRTGLGEVASSKGAAPSAGVGATTTTTQTA
ncbi:MAG: MHYT domain-containing protein [Gammaproteobacteria bacterium]|nr:MHYT domain-containing protein [Gammaproteobacteria bacterium]